MNGKGLKIFSYIYLILPIVVFVIGWTKPIICSLAIICLSIIIIRRILNNEDCEAFITKKKILIIFLGIIIICILAGQGGMFYQSFDWHWRNAIFRDLINFKWPVYYEQLNCNLTYYIGIWMIPALVGKAMKIIYEPLAWQTANIALLLWSAIGVTLSMLWLIKILKIKNSKKILLAIIIFLGFSGLDIIGVIITKDICNTISALHIEWWAHEFEFSSHTTQLFWVFNQSIVAWLITAMFLDEKRVNNYMLLILLCLPYAPLPFIGLIPLLGIRGIKFLINSVKKKEMKKFIREVFSLENILSLVAILPIFYFYYSNNTAINGTGRMRLENSLLNIKGIVFLITFWFLEIGVYGILLFKNNKRNELFYTALITLFIVPTIRIGSAIDFSMRVSIPSITIISFLTIKYILEEWDSGKRINPRTLILLIILAIGMITPLFEYARAFKNIEEKGKLNLVADKIITFSDKNPNDSSLLLNNFVSNSSKDSIFFKYLAK